jgi:signal transduction histidine kinase
VKEHGGEVAYETEMGKGTTFILRLPLESPACGTDAERAMALSPA